MALLEENNGNNIEPGFHVQVFFENICFGSFHNPFDFGICNRFRGVLIADSVARFHFDDYQLIAILRHNVEFEMTIVPVGVFDFVAQL